MTLALPSDDIRCLNELRGTHMFLVARANKIRAYKVDSRFTSELRQILTLAVGRNIECGAGLIMRENQELCDLYDVHDDEELYEIIRSFVRPGSVPGLEMGSTPLIRLGKTDRKNQMVDVLRDAGTELSREFAQRYAEKYCIETKTVRNNYLRDMNAYLRNGRYSYVDSNLTDEQQQFIKDMLTEDYVSLPYVTASFAAKFGAASDRLVNDQSLAPLAWKSPGISLSRKTWTCVSRLRTCLCRATALPMVLRALATRSSTIRNLGMPLRRCCATLPLSSATTIRLFRSSA